MTAGIATWGTGDATWGTSGATWGAAGSTPPPPTGSPRRPVRVSVDFSLEPDDDEDAVLIAALLRRHFRL